ncbi:hypothetical protein [Bauldia sp.]|uniref:hypothetical protein n=1 Tax=Bauldia sp. TaxID=2575872 RepID=UPI003BAA65AE
MPVNPSRAIRLMFARALAVVAVVALAIPVATDTAAAGRFDGDWKVYVYGAPGKCAFGYRLPLTIDDGDVLYKGRKVHPRVIGVSSAGAVAIQLGSGRNVVTGTGALNARRGSGKWSAPRFRCTGWWRAVKQ